MKNKIKEFLDKRNVFAVVGVSRNPEKYGSEVFKDLKDSGYKVYPLNPHISKIQGDKCYPKLEDLPIKPDVVNIIVSPKITYEIVKDCKKLKINKVWMQPGSESKTAIKFCEDNDIKVLHGTCVMVKRRKLLKTDLIKI